MQTWVCALVTGDLWNKGLWEYIPKPHYPRDRKPQHMLLALKLCKQPFVQRWITVHPYTDMYCPSPGFTKSLKSSLLLKSLLPNVGNLKSFPSQLHLHFQFGRAHCFSQFVAGLAHVNPRVRRFQISHNQRTKSVFVLLHGHSARFTHWLLIVKPLQLRLRVT